MCRCEMCQTSGASSHIFRWEHFYSKEARIEDVHDRFCALPLHTTILARCLKHKEHGRPTMKRVHARLAGGLVAACPIFQANSELRRRVLIAPTSVEQTWDCHARTPHRVASLEARFDHCLHVAR